MKVLLVHNRYRERGGEDVVFEAERDLLRSRGMEVETATADNHAIATGADRIRALARMADHPRHHAPVVERLRAGRFDLVHVHNFFPLLSPGLHRAIAALGVPVVQTLHNYRLLCANGLFLRNGRPCEDCLSMGRHRALLHRCYRGSMPATAGVLRMQSASIRSRPWLEAVSRFIVLTRFARDKFASHGLPPGKIAIKPNFVDDPGPPAPSPSRSGALFVGRLSPEKGVRLLVETWRSIPGIPLTVVGDGPEMAAARAIAPANVRFTGALARKGVLRHMAEARFLVAPSLLYEGFPVTMAESLACGLPVIAPRLGAFPEIIDDGRTGFLFMPGEGDDLLRAVRMAFAEGADHAALGRNARSAFERRLTPDANYRMLRDIYASVLARPGSAQPGNSQG